MLDVGETLDEGRRSTVESVRQESSSQWPSMLEPLFANRDINKWSSGIPMKLSFGSSYPYGIDRGFAPLGSGEFIPPSFARGGYSNVWGATMLPYSDSDITDWPFGVDELEPHYRAVLENVPLTGARDALARDFPFYKSDSDVHPLSLQQQMGQFIDDANRARSELQKDGISAGVARLGLFVDQVEGSLGCQSCGLCLHGCAAEAIYSSRHTLDRLIRSGKVEYRRGFVVRTFEEREGKVNIDALNLSSGQAESMPFDLAFLGAGTLSTGRIMLESLPLGDTLSILESQKFLIPCLRFKSSDDVFERGGLQLPGAFLEVRDDDPGGRWAHLQLSPMNDLALDRLGIHPEKMSLGQQRLWAKLLGRVIFAWGGLHSTDSESITLRLERRADSSPSVLHVESRHGKCSAPAMNRLKRKLWRHVSSLRMFPLTFLARHPHPGGGHNGGTFPMRLKPEGPFESDLLGRPTGLSRVHLVDSSVFPSVPATTIGLTIMANAYRIGSNADLFSA
jgi:choline dehydrogenase-like flavoprotein